MSADQVAILPINLNSPCETMSKILDLLHYYNIKNIPQIDPDNREVYKVVLKHSEEFYTIEISEYKNWRGGKLEATVDVIYTPPPYFRLPFTSNTKGHKFVNGNDLIEALQKAQVAFDPSFGPPSPVFRPVYKTRSPTSFALDLKGLDSRISRLL